MTVPLGLARRTLGGGALFFFSVGASSPMTVLVGGVVATFAGTGIVAVPAAFPIITVALALFTVGYVAMARHVPHAGPLYAYVGRGLGPGWGLVVAPIALLSYNAIAISLYGLLGTVMSGAVGGPWWLWGLVAWAVVAMLGVGHVAVNARLLALLLVAEIGVIVLMDAAALTHPADGQVSLAPLLPGNLTQVGAGGVFALSVAAFIGYESSLAYGEEARGHTAVARATIGSLLFIGVLYAVSSWAMTVAVGPDHIVDAARDPAAGLPLSIVVEHYGRTLGLLAGALLVTSVFAAMLSLHNTAARYVFVLSRERLLRPAFGRVGRGTRAGAPIGGSVLQSTLGLAVLTGCAVVGADPLRVLFTQLSAVAAIGVMTLMVAVSVAALRFYQRGGGTNEGPWTRVVAPLAGAVSVGAILLTAVVNLDSLLGVGPPATVVLPGVVVLAGAAGGLWGVRVRRQPEVYRAIGRGEPEPLAELEQHLAHVDV